MSDGSVSAAGSMVREARRALRGAQRVLVLTGAGVSAESGVPTFRGPGGLWKSFRSEELATPEAFARDPRLVWEWYSWRRDLVAGCAPNAAHLACARFALTRPGTLIVTQNVDGLHHRAAALAADQADPTPAQPLELHGAIHRERCTSCARRFPSSSRVDTSSLAALPRCSDCGSLLRPDVVWFGEELDAEILGAAWDAAENADVCLVVGTSAMVHPAAGIPDVTLSSGGAVIEVNPQATTLTPRATWSFRDGAATLTPALLG